MPRHLQVFYFAFAFSQWAQNGIAVGIFHLIGGFAVDGLPDTLT